MHRLVYCLAAIIAVYLICAAESGLGTASGLISIADLVITSEPTNLTVKQK